MKRSDWITEDHNPQTPQLDEWDMPRGDEYQAAVRVTGEPTTPPAPIPETNFRAAAIIMAIALSGCVIVLTVALVASILGVWRA